jgi:hypothetical protein
MRDSVLSHWKPPYFYILPGVKMADPFFCYLVDLVSYSKIADIDSIATTVFE